MTGVSDSAARRAAKRAGLRAIKSRCRPSYDNQGGYMLVDAYSNYCKYGERFDLTPAEVVEICREQPKTD